jgi:small-conductance mechanosensitive channel
LDDLAEVLLHPSRWNDLSALPTAHRLVLALTALAFSSIVAWIVGILSDRWARARAGRAGESGAPLSERIAQIRRGLTRVVLFIGAYFAVEAAPLPSKIERALAGTLFVLGAWSVARLITHLVGLLLATSVAHVAGEDRARLEREYVPLGQKITTLVVGLILVIVVAKYFGQDVTSLVAALGVGSLAIGLAAQQTLGNMIAGFVLLVDRPFRPGDRIKLASGEAGDVLEIGVRSTRITLLDKNLLIVPNAELVNSRVVNFEFPTSAGRGDVRVQVSPAADLQRATQLLLAIAADDERVAKQPAPSVAVTAIRPGAVELSLGFDVIRYGEVFGAEERARRKLIARFAEEKIPLAVPPLEALR